MDVVSSSFYNASNDSKICWHENDGYQNFTQHIISTTAIGPYGSTSVFARDVDLDGDIDVLSASGYDNKITWYENQLISKVVKQNPTTFSHTFVLSNNYPNPFNSQTTIEFTLTKRSDVIFKILNTLGQIVYIENLNNLSIGPHSIYWSGRDIEGKELPSGIYFYILSASSESKVKKMLLLK